MTARAGEHMILDILTQTDFAGAIEQTYHCPGAAKLSALFNKIRAKNSQGTLVLDAGDVLCAAPICNLTDGAPVIDVMNLLGIDAMTLGNHEFDNGPDAMQMVLKNAAFPILCANILDTATGQLPPFARPYVMLERLGLSIGIIGVTTEHTPFMLRPDRFAGFTVLQPAEVLCQLVPKLRAKGADMIIVLGHLPGEVAPDGTRTGELFETASAIPPVEVMIGGHNPGSIAYAGDQTVFAKAGFSAGEIAHIRLTLDENKRIIERSVRIYDMMGQETAALVPDAAVQRAVDRAMGPYRPALNEPLATLSRRLDADKDKECALGNFYTDGLRDAGQAQIGLFNATSIFGFMPAGVVTAEMVIHVMCFDEDIYVGDMRGQQLYDLFERTYTAAHWRGNGALQFSGMRAVVDTRRPEGARVVSLTLEDGRPIEKTARLRVATTDYIAMGGNDYQEIMANTLWQNTHIRTHAHFIDFFRRRGVIPAETDGRMKNLDSLWV